MSWATELHLALGVGGGGERERGREREPNEHTCNKYCILKTIIIKLQNVMNTNQGFGYPKIHIRQIRPADFLNKQMRATAATAG